MEKSEVRNSTELLKLENPKATAECHLAKLVCFTNSRSNVRHAERLKTSRLHSNSVLNRVKDFLPDLKRANEDLKTAIVDRGQMEFDIENVDNADSVIEMNLALVEREVISEDSSSSSSSSCESSDESDSDDTSKEPTSKCKKANIETLSSSTSEVIERDSVEQQWSKEKIDTK